MDEQILLYRNRWLSDQDGASLARYLKALVRAGLEYKIIGREVVNELLYLPILRRHLDNVIELLPRNKIGEIPEPSIQEISSKDVRCNLGIVTSREELPELRKFLREMANAMNAELEAHPLQQFLRSTPQERWGPKIREGVGFFLDFPHRPDITTQNALEFHTQVLPLWVDDRGDAVITFFIRTD